MKTKIIIAIGVIAIAFSSGWIVNGWRLSVDSTAEKLSAVQANADHFADVSRKVNTEASQYVKKTYELKNEIDSLKKELAHAKKNHPVPADCRPDPDRLRGLKDAVTAANTAAGQ